MIRYALACDNGHAFESWFQNSAAYDKQVGRGLVAYDAAEADKIKGKPSGAIAQILGFDGRAEMIHRDDMVLAGQ